MVSDSLTRGKSCTNSMASNCHLDNRAPCLASHHPHVGDVIRGSHVSPTCEDVSSDTACYLIIIRIIETIQLLFPLNRLLPWLNFFKFIALPLLYRH